MTKRIIFILGIGSDIGRELAFRYLSEENNIILGTYRSEDSVKELVNNKEIILFKCDLHDKKSIEKVVAEYGAMYKKWDMFISCVGTLEPIGNFFDCEFDKWNDSLAVNSTGQLRFLHSIYPYRNENKISDVVFFAGGGTNNPLRNYSAYCVSKLSLIKMCELLDDENNDLNVFIVGPGWVRTKIFKQTLNNRETAGKIYEQTIDFLESDSIGTSHDDIYSCINWCVEQGRQIIGGRNISVVHDAWRDGGRELVNQLLLDSDKFKLRRFKNSE